MDDFEKLIARKIFQVMREQRPGDVSELRRLAVVARARGYLKIADHAEEMAILFETEDLLRQADE